MSDIVIGKGSGEETFRTRTVVLILAVGILGFIATLVLGAFAPDLRSGRNGGAHALSTSATGYSGIVRLAKATGRNPQVTRDEHLLNTKSLVILTPEKGATDMSGVLAQRGKRPTLVILPKWDTLVDPLHSGWVHYTGLKPTFEADGVLAPADKLTTVRHPSGGRPLRISTDLPQTIRLFAPRPLQTISGRGIVPLITDQDGRIVLARLPGRDLFVLADPDLLSNIGMANATQAKSALELLDSLNYADRESILFDVTLNGFGHSRSPLKLLFEPPFLAMTLAVAVAVLLAALQGIVRFGSPRPRERAIAFGKAALIDNAAMLVRKAGRQAMLGPRYVDTIRERAVTVFGVSPQLRDGALDTYLDGLGRRERFTDLAENARNARDRRSVFAAAQALHLWLWEKNR
ncbi:hypothetical protein G4G27_04330 [Sphingomonas sp. So64.6b]|uniref:hypothetical protein n=1 Tax=Sphingomonas sp. So64.6b TaxID=2997354 RepID=UPI00160374EF|nr:hypothetical protein [Sphingomonas sp. So64.6b]QNA83319.1 hypothetical protein G4G27_04330 [Sphingomonas sp. So64.6b]